MTEQEEDRIRAIVRAAVEKHLAGRPASTGSAPGALAAAPLHFSFGQYVLTRAPGDSRCLIEPTVGCVHCGYCQCHGY